VCWDYYFKYIGGGNIGFKLMGISIGLLNNISYFLIKFVAGKIGFRNTAVRNRFIFLASFIICYANSGLFVSEDPG